MVPGRKRGGGLVEAAWLAMEPGPSAQGEGWLTVMAGLQAVLVGADEEMSALAGAAAAP